MADSMTFYSDPSRANYDIWLNQFNSKLASGQPVDSYENTVDWAVSNFGGNVSPQEIGSTLYNTYANYGPAPTQVYYGGYVKPMSDTGSTTDSGTGSGTGGGLTAAEIAAEEARKMQALNTHLANLDQIRINRQKATDDSNAQYQGLLQNEQDLTTQRGKGYEQNSAYFSNVSPDAFQSQILNYNQKVLDAYNQGMNTVANNRENIRIAKENTLAGLASQEQGENSFNQATGYYDQPYTYTPINYQSPVLTPVTQSPYSQSAMFPGQAAQWSPNKVGAEDDPYKFLK